jgi:hypothetical protein
MSKLQIRCWKTKKYYEVDVDCIPDLVFREAVILGLRDLLNRGMNKQVGASMSFFEAKAKDNQAKIMSGSIRYSKLPR